MARSGLVVWRRSIWSGSFDCGFCSFFEARGGRYDMYTPPSQLRHGMTTTLSCILRFSFYASHSSFGKIALRYSCMHRGINWYDWAYII